MRLENTPAPVPATTDQDIKYFYNLFLHRDAEDQSRIKQNSGKPLVDILELFVRSNEYHLHIVKSLGTQDGNPRPYRGIATMKDVKSWAANRLPLHPDTRERLIQAPTWEDVDLALLQDPVVAGWIPILQEANFRKSLSIRIATRKRQLSAAEATIPVEVSRSTRPHAEFEEFRPIPERAQRRAKLLTYYLPQFHSFPENDLWWGKGFTEWTNLSRGIPRFAGHYQPRVPRDLGFYNLTDTETIRRQAAYAKGAGIFGFVFYYYWFDGKRLMEKPLDLFLADQTIDLPFCLMWANENWTRSWDGGDNEVLIRQHYDSRDEENMLAEFARHFSDRRYIRIQDRPLLMIYRPTLIPDSANSIRRWRDAFRSNFSENPILIMAQAFGDFDPVRHGFDAAIEFPPHKLTHSMHPVNSELTMLDPDFSGRIYWYEDLVRSSLREPTPSFPLIKTAVPNWDNTPRRQKGAAVMTGSTPTKYERWLTELIDQACEHPFLGEPIVCINAWNEWCEGAYLEPDLHFGAAYLNATGRSVTGMPRHADAPKLLLIGHDAFPSGAQHGLLHIARTLRRSFGLEIEILLLEGGLLQAAYENTAPLTIATGNGNIDDLLVRFRDRGFENVIANTVASANLMPGLKHAVINAVVLIHELPNFIRQHHLQAHLHAALEHARYTVFPNLFVRNRVAQEFEIALEERHIVLPQGNYANYRFSDERRDAMRLELGIAPEEKLVLGVGYADLRKGFDLFLQLWRLLQESSAERMHLCWLGNFDPEIERWLGQEIDIAKASGTFHVPGYRENVGDYLSAADVLALTSREDPFPTVVLEALGIGLPVAAFEGSGGTPQLLSQDWLGIVVPYCDVVAMANGVWECLRNDDRNIRSKRQEFVRSTYSHRTYVEELLKIALPDLASISVAVPNYNYSRYLPKRLASIFQQSHPISELLVLDDCSTDDSIEIVERVAADWEREVQVFKNESNSGSVFEQWRRACALSKGDFVWIAEADDSCDPAFLKCMLAQLTADPSIVFAFCDSRSIDEAGAPIWPSYKPYYSTVDRDGLSTSAVFDGRDFSSRFLSVKNLILNVSSVVWRREVLATVIAEVGPELKEHRITGDWRLYLQALLIHGAKVVYEARPMNVHRRHANSTTHMLDPRCHVKEVARMQALARAALELSEEILFNQQHYLVELAQQFGLSEFPTAATASEPVGSPS